MTYVVAHAASLTFLLLVFHATGHLVSRMTRLSDDVGQRTGLMHIALGIAVWMYLLMAFAWVGLYRPGVLVGAALVVGLAGVGSLFVVRSARLQAGPQGPAKAGRHVHVDSAPGARVTALGALAWLPPAIVLAQVFVRTLGPWLGWDDQSAHLTLPRVWLAHGGFLHLPFNVYSHWPSNIQLLYGLGLAVEDYVLGKLLHWMFLVLLTIAVYRFAARAAAPWAGLVAASLLLANDVVLAEAPIANIDIGVAFFFFLAVTLAIEFRETRKRRALLLAGVFCGVVAGSKITGLGAVVCVLPLVLLGSTRRAFVRDTAVFVMSAFALALPWLIKSYVETGDPLYPVLWKYVGGIEWNATIADQFWRWQNSIGMGRTPRDYALLPIRVILNGGAGYDNFAAWISKTWIVFLPLTLACCRWVPAARRVLLPAAIYFVIWANSSQQTRFLISVLPLLAVATAVTAAFVVDKSGELVRMPIVKRLMAGTVVLTSIAVLAWASRYMRNGSLEATRNLFVDPPNIEAWTPDPAYTFVRQQLPASANVLMLNTNHGFFLDRDYVADSFFEASQLNASIAAAGNRDGLTRLFGNLGVTHVFVDRAPWVKFPPMLWDYLRDAANATELYRSPNGPFIVYALKRG